MHSSSEGFVVIYAVVSSRIYHLRRTTACSRLCKKGTLFGVFFLFVLVVIFVRDECGRLFTKMWKLGTLETWTPQDLRESRRLVKAVETACACIAGCRDWKELSPFCLSWKLKFE